MPPLTLWDVMVIGIYIRRLQRVRRDTPVQPSHDASIMDCLETIEEFLQEAQLENTWRRLGNRLQDAIRSLEDWEENQVGAMAPRLQTLAHDLSESIEEETSQRAIFFPIPARQIEVTQLLANPTEWFLQRYGEAFPQAPPGVVEDFEEAAKAFAAGFAASAIMFALRATEGILREYFRRKTGNDPGSRTWGQIVNDLRGQIPDSLWARLDALRELRNTAMHAGPRQPSEWNDESAVRVLLECREIIAEIAEDLIER